MKNIFATLDASIGVFFQIVHRYLTTLIAIFLPINVFLAYAHSQTMLRFVNDGSLPMAAFNSERNYGNAYDFLFGLLAVAIVVRAAWRITEQPTDENDVYGTVKSVWFRALGVNALRALVITGFIIVAIIVIALLIRGIPFVGFILNLTIIAIGVWLMIRWMLADNLCMLFKLNPGEALKNSFAMTSGHVGEILAIWILATSVTAAFNLIPSVIYGCDTFGYYYPFTDENIVVRILAAAGYAVVGTVIDIIQLYPVVAFTLYIRGRMEGTGFLALAKPGRAGAVSVIGLLYIIAAVAIIASRFSIAEPKRVFRMENMDIDQTDTAYRYDIVLSGICGDRRAIANVYLEKPTPLEHFSRQRYLWAEVPFCSKCHAGFARKSAFSEAPECAEHELDTYAFKCRPFEKTAGGFSMRYTPDTDTLLPTDVQRTMTEEEKSRVNKLLREYEEKQKEKPAATPRLERLPQDHPLN